MESLEIKPSGHSQVQMWDWLLQDAAATKEKDQISGTGTVVTGNGLLLREKLEE